MQRKLRNSTMPLVAVIREDECIGCTKCIEACPADAILGSASLMHTVIADECIGCQLCVSPCPVDCIDMVAVMGAAPDKMVRKQKADKFKERYQVRVERIKKEELKQGLVVAVDKQSYISAALERVRARKK